MVRSDPDNDEVIDCLADFPLDLISAQVYNHSFYVFWSIFISLIPPPPPSQVKESEFKMGI